MPSSESDQTHPREKEVFLEAVEIRDADERGALLEKICAGDEGLRRRVESLLGNDAAPGHFMANPEVRDMIGAIKSGFLEAEEKPDFAATTRADDERRPTPAIAAKMSRDGLKKVGRYQIAGSIGEGSFGTVFKGFDPHLNRFVALKMVHPKRIALLESLDDWFDEAKVLASLRHDGIVRVYDADKTEDGEVYIVSEYIEGQTLGEVIKEGGMSVEKAVRILLEVTEAAHAAHLSGLVHRDIKPGNIMIRPDGQACLIDFGIALSKQQPGNSLASGVAGTPAYMSPEQTRSEGHLVDRRSDIFSLGVVFYELLAGRRPFPGRDFQKVFAQIQSGKIPKLPFTNPPIPKEVQRICEKCLAPRASERYQDAHELFDDLNCFLNPPEIEEAVPEDTTVAVVVPKGLRSFEESDSDFFFQLLPGPFDRHGLPDSVRFWKTRIEAQSTGDGAFRIGMIYGPSGSGKSSLLKAGVLPHLPDWIEVILVEASRQNTSENLSKKLAERLDCDPETTELPEMMRQLRARPNGGNRRKTLLVFDQFEQWLYAREHGQVSGEELVRSLRQCDGDRTQAVLVIRDDFWVPASRLMKDLDCDLRAESNGHFVELFSEEHGRTVLRKFGRAFGRLNGEEGEPTATEAEFITESVRSLAVEGRIAPVQLALFAEMFKNREWTLQEFRRVGGAQGIGVTFFDENFIQRTADPRFRSHREAVKRVLESLLPEDLGAIKGLPQSEAEMLKHAGYEDQPERFEELLSILDTELKVITPVNLNADGESGNSGYQLTHDYLVPAVRDWLQRKKRETARGRAELRLSDLATSFEATGEKRHLPSFWEWAKFKLLTKKASWNRAQQQMMSAAFRKVGAHLALVILAGALISGAVLIFGKQVDDERLARLMGVSPTEAGAIINQFGESKSSMIARAEHLLKDPKLGGRSRLNLSLLVLEKNPEMIPVVQESLLRASPTEFSAIIDLIEEAGHSAQLVEAFRRILADTNPQWGHRLRALCGLAMLDGENANWKAWSEDSRELILSLSPEETFGWGPALANVSPVLKPMLSNAFGKWDGEYSEEESPKSRAAAELLATFEEADPAELVRLIERASPTQLNAMMPVFRRNREALTQLLRPKAEITHLPHFQAESLEKAARLKAKAIVLVSSLDSDSRLLLDAFETPAHPVVLERILEFIEPCEVSPEILKEGLARGESTETVRATLLALGRFSEERISTALRGSLEPELLRAYLNPDAGTHAAASWVLGKWEVPGDRIPGVAPSKGYVDGRNWRRTSGGHTMVLIEAQGGKSEIFEIAATETTVGEFSKFRILEDENGSDAHPVTEASLYDFFEYCNWMSKQEGISENQWCFVPSEDGSHLVPAPDYFKRTGFRLPSEREWHLAANSHYGIDQTISMDISARYAGVWHVENSSGICHPVAQLHPNRFGVFDIFGNCREWAVFPRPNQPETSSYSLIGGDYQRLLRAHFWIGILSGAPNSNDPNLGFRLARSVKISQSQ